MPIISEEQVRRASQHHCELSDQLARNHQDQMPLVQLQEEITRAADLPLDEAVTLPKEAYTSEALFGWERTHLFCNDWICLAHQSQIAQRGDFLNIDFMSEPLLIVRDKAGEIQVLSRVCPHRGMDIMPPGFGYDGHGPAQSREGGAELGHTRLLLCPYHSWTFDLDGQLKACPEMNEARHFDRSDWALKQYRMEVWEGFIFVNFDGAATKSVAQQYRKMQGSLANWKLGELEIAHQSHWEIACNWKVLAENFMESYHHAGTHLKTLHPIMPAKDTYNDQEYPHHIRAHLPYGKKACREIEDATQKGEQWDAFPPIRTLDADQRRKWELYMGFPLFFIVAAPEQLVWYRVEPVAPNRIRLMTSALVPRSTKHHPEYERMLERGREEALVFHLEDLEVLSAVQRSYYSSGYQSGRLSHLEMSVWQIQRYLAARFRGVYPTEDRAPAPAQK